MIPKLQALRIAFFGTKSFAAYHLYVLLHCSIHNIIAVFTQENPSFNQRSSWSVFKVSTAYKLNLFLSHNLLISNMIRILEKLKIDIIVVVSYGIILPQKILVIPKFGCINIHGSLLPRWRGSAPIQRAIEYGDSITGISIIQMNSGVDTGNILYNKTCKISSTDNSYTLSKKLAQIGSTGLLQTIEKIMLNTYQIIGQNALHATYASKLNKLEARINWKLSAIELERQIRAFNPWPVSYFYIYQRYIKVWTAKVSNQNIEHNTPSRPPGMIIKTNQSGIYVATGSGILILITLQISGKKKSSAKDFLNSYNAWFKLNTVLT